MSYQKLVMSSEAAPWPSQNTQGRGTGNRTAPTWLRKGIKPIAESRGFCSCGEAGQGHQSLWVLSAAPVPPRAAQKPSLRQAGEFGVPGLDCPSLNLERVCCSLRPWSATSLLSRSSTALLSTFSLFYTAQVSCAIPACAVLVTSSGSCPWSHEGQE